MRQRYSCAFGCHAFVAYVNAWCFAGWCTFYNDCKTDTSPCKIISTAEVSISAGEQALRSRSKNAAVLPCTTSDAWCGCEAQLAPCPAGEAGWFTACCPREEWGSRTGSLVLPCVPVQAEPPGSLVSSAPPCRCPPLTGEVRLWFWFPEPFQSLALLSNWSSKRKSGYSDFWKSKPVSWVLVAVLRRSVSTTMLKDACPVQH